jgi:beta-galactosidase GanA
MASSGSFPFGASYSPLIFPESDWDKDLSLMQASGMNLIRAGDVHGSWDRMEPREGEYELEILGKFYSRADQFGLQILLSNGASCPPLWLAKKYPGALLLSSRGERYPLAASYHWACIHHPGYLEGLEAYTRTLAEFAIRQPNHFGWQITNEIGFPFMPARDANQLGLYCYCSHCKMKFQEWVKEKYSTLGALTEAWSWSTTNFVYNAWDDVAPPESLPASWSGVTRWIDWRLFWQQAFADYAGWQHQMIKQIDPEHPTSINTFNFKGFDRFGTFMGLDQWQIAEQVDHIGYDLYPGSGNKLASRPEHSSMFLDHGRSVSESVGSDFWIHEIESGPIGGWLMGPNRNTDARDVLNYTVECLGHNAKVLLYMPWKEWAYQPLRWGALVDLDSNLTERYEQLKPFGKLLQENADFLRVAKTRNAKVAIVESKPNAIFLRGTDDEELLFKAQRGAYRVFWERGFSVDFIPHSQLSVERLSSYDHILLPLLGLLSEENALVLAECVKNGGIVIGFARLSTLDENGWYHHQLPIQGIKMIFGFEKVVADSAYSGQISFGGTKYPARLNRDMVKVREGVDVVGEFDDGKPAVMINRYGSGMGVYLATHADGAFVGDPSNKLLSDVIQMVLEERSSNSDYEIRGAGNRATGIDPHILKTDKKAWVLFTNYLESESNVSFSLRTNQKKPEFVREIFPTETIIGFSVDDESILLDGLMFGPKEVKIVEIIWS